MRSLNGGYTMIDLKNADFSEIGDGVLVDGVFEKLRDAMKTGKPIFAYNFNTGAEKSPVEMSVSYDTENEVFLVDVGALSMEVGADNTFREQE